MGLCIIGNKNWVYYWGEVDTFDKDKVGRWVHFFDKGGVEYIKSVCKEAIEQGIIGEIKHSNAEAGICCFYLNSDDVEGHKRVIGYLLDKGLIRKTPNGRIYDMGFKLENGEESDIRVSDFIDMETGEWLV